MSATLVEDRGQAGSAGSAEPREASGRREPPDDSALSTMENHREADASRSPAVGSARQADPTRQAEPAERKTRKRKAWAPNRDDQSIHEWVMLKGESQSFVAELFGISQPTVSRIVERYEKWRAHAEPREDGGLDPAERVRAQRMLTYERNERIIRNCLRLAGEVERCVEVSSSTSAAPEGGLAGMREIRVANKMLERTGMASRFYRLAHRVGMEQLELVEQEPAVMPVALSDEEEAEQEAQAAADRAELQAVQERHEEEVKRNEKSLEERLAQAEQEAALAREQAAAAKRELEGVLELLAETQRELAAAERGPEEESGRDREAETEGQSDGATDGAELTIRAGGEKGVVELKLHNLNNVHAAENGASAERACVCTKNGAPEKNLAKVNNRRASPGEDALPRPPRGETMQFTPAD